MSQLKSADRSGTPGFEHVPKLWDSELQQVVAKVLPGQYYVSTGKDLVGTVLGSCVSACVRDTRMALGGMNHFMLPDLQGDPSEIDDPHRYGAFAMEAMLNDLFRRGASRQYLEVKIVGGGSVMRSSSRVGERNIEFVQEYLANEGLPIASQDVGTLYARRVVYDVKTGQMLVKRIESAESVRAEEEKYLQDVSVETPSGDVELF